MKEAWFRHESSALATAEKMLIPNTSTNTNSQSAGRKKEGESLERERESREM